ncbi:ankyrin repeat domain-containing protein 54 isoform X2 [Ischnura elegans]|uniref:ankyrin repeat domain-containing protein 54 isoform X2 n=1 Tax=Ischnura elegans TaxID=197161 RepID=UPI001ED8AFE8|nr:ankyrin repeat domain-containing protein 54 isoform X2 [Ischnura elegans]
MTTVDSGVETSNDSDDSSATHDYQPVENNSPVKMSCSTLPSSPFNAFPSLSQESDKERQEESDRRLALTFRPPTLRTSPGLQMGDVGAIGLAASNTPSTSQIKFAIPLKSFGHASLCGESGSDNRGYKEPLKTKIRVVRQRHAFINLGRLHGERKLRLAASTNNVEEVRRLLNNGINPNCYDNHRRSPLHLSSCRGYAEVVRALLEYGANPNQRDALGNTPLHLAACTNNVAVVTLLLKAGTDVSSNDMHGRNPLKLAMSKLRLLKSLSSSKYDGSDSHKIKLEVQQVIEMLQEYLNKRGRETEAELLTAFSSRLNLSSSPKEVDDEVRELLSSLNSLSIQSPGTPSENPSTSSFMGSPPSLTSNLPSLPASNNSEMTSGASSPIRASTPQLRPPSPVVPFRLPPARFDFPCTLMTNPFRLAPPCFEAPFASISPPPAPASSPEGEA